nr:YqeG family HAD IIIA-type phosphatase [Candidatus Phytoplasma sacchari]
MFSNYLPDFHYKSFFDIPYDFFFNIGIKVLIFDLDNTLLSSGDNKLNFETINKLNEIKKKFKIFILSNTSKKKLIKILNPDFYFIHLKWYQKKPSIYGFKKVLDLFDINSYEALMIGDQLMTDIFGSNKMDILSILVKPVNRKKEFFFTKLIRFLFEYPIIKYIKKKYPQIYIDKFKNFI